ncbi:GSCFA family protein [Acuticoccus sediminis]|uniref:GSCFA family protein n=1 Tax=Acuticoccus sediminis TaxID=2184697 RepID=A0A8B2NKS3_9HYPH|nr:GSCFA domain-containing protein [Acuticoccus sediminis]RAH96836.1 GSCFA family protein [Acuticoccus sediminis]
MTHPYKTLPEEAFWAPAVAKRHPLDIQRLWTPKFNITHQTPIVTFGSCFAQHIGRAMAARGYAWTSTEPTPKGLSPENAIKFNYDIFSARTANIYTTSLLEQWVSWGTGATEAPDVAWETSEGRFLDPFRPLIEPGGFESRDEMLASRAVTITAFGEAIRKARVFVFTLGLTESWYDTDGYEYPMCPGTVGGNFDPARHKFRNQRYPEIRRALRTAIKMMETTNPGLHFLLTVSPVPLTATNSGEHVLVATTHSKSILRAVAGETAETLENVDYFPSYEIITSPAFRGSAFEPNMRSVNMHGVTHVMDCFFADLQNAFPESGSIAVRGGRRSAARKAKFASHGANSDEPQSASDLACEEELLDAFGGRAQ